MRFKQVGRVKTLSQAARKPTDTLEEIEELQRQTNYLQNPAMFGKTLSNESTIRTRGNCINVQVVRSGKHSLKDLDVSPRGIMARRRSRKDRSTNKPMKPTTFTMNSREGGISNLSKSLKGKSKKNGRNAGNSRDAKSRSIHAKSSKKQLSKSRSRNDEARLTTQSQIEECENIKITDHEFNNTRNLAKSCISEKSKPSSYLSQTVAVSGHGIKMSTKSPKHDYKASRDFNRQNTSQSDVLGTKRSNHVKKKSSGDQDLNGDA